MKTLNLALIATLILTSASVMATSTGTNWSTTISASHTSVHQEGISERIGSGSITSYQDILGSNGGVIGQSQLIEQVNIENVERSVANGEINGGYTSISNGFAAGVFSLDVTDKLGSTASHFESESYTLNLTSGTYTEISNASIEGNINMSVLTGTIYKESKIDTESQQDSLKLYGSSYESVDFNY
jgi:hypothetical protein